MALTLPAKWLEVAQRAGVEWIFHVEIKSTSGLTVQAVSSLTEGSVLGGESVGVVQVNPISIEIEPVSRRLQIGFVSVTFLDSWLRPLVVAHRLKGQKITIKLGEKTLDLVDYAPFFVGEISAIIPNPNGNTIDLECRDILSVLKTRKVQGFWNILSPLTVIQDLLTKAGVPTSLIDTASLLPANHPEISHLVVGRSQLAFTGHDDGTVREPTPAFDLISQLLQTVHGTLVPDETGKLSFVRVDTAAATIADWDDDIIGDFDQDPVDENVINRVTIDFLGFPREWSSEGLLFSPDPTTGVTTITPGAPPAHAFQMDETVSQAALAFPDGGGGVFEVVIDMPWVNGIGLFAGAVPAGATTIRIATFGDPHITGTRDLILPSGQPADAKVSASKPAWFFQALTAEIFKATAIVPDFDPAVSSSAPERTYVQLDPETGNQITVGNIPVSFSATVERSQRGTVAVADSPGQNFNDYAFVDITIPIFLAEEILKRFSDGAMIARLSTSFVEYDKQVGDLVTLDHRHALDFGFDGVVKASGKWEIIGKEPDIYSDPPRVKWKLLFIPNADITTVERSWKTYHQQSDAVSYDEGSSGQIFTNIWVVDGLELATVSGLTIRVSPGLVATSTGTFRLDDDLDIILGASRDIYFHVSLNDGTIIPIEVFNGAAEPDSTSHPHIVGNRSVFIGKAITDATTITQIIQERDASAEAFNVQTQALNGNRIQNNSLGTNSLDTSTQQTTSQVPNSDFGSFEDEDDPVFAGNTLNPFLPPG